MAYFYYKIAPKAPLFKTFTYKSSLELQIGQRVKIPFRSKKIKGFVLDKEKNIPPSSIFIKEILEVDKSQAPLAIERLDWMSWMSEYYHYPLGDILDLSFFSNSFKPYSGLKQKKKALDQTLKKNLLHLNSQQQHCVEQISQTPFFQVHLIHGVTGSGKTEVYIHLISKILEQGLQVLVLLPEIFLTPQIVTRLSQVFPNQTAVWHSQVTPAQKKRESQSLFLKEKNLLVGTRSALFCPLPKLGLIVIDEEHDSSFKQEEKLRYNARDSAIVLAKKENVPIVLGSATPDFSSYNKALNSSYKLYELKKRALKQDLPQVLIADLKKERKKSSLFWMSDLLFEKMEHTLKKGKQVALFLNRRGQATAMLCASCGHRIKCVNCDISLTLHNQDYLICHYCSYLEKKPNRCCFCQSDHLLEKGLGTQKVEEEIKKLFPNYKTLRFDRDSISSQKEMLEFIKKVEFEEIQILIGTQMLSKGLNFPSLHLVGVLLADMDFNFPDFRAEERAFQTLLQMGGRAGRAGLGEVVLQTFYPKHVNFDFVVKHDYKAFFSKSLKSRQTWNYPPFSRLCLLKIDCFKETEGRIFSAELAKWIKAFIQNFHKSSQKTSFQSLGPSPAPLGKIKNRYRFQILIKAENSTLLSYFLKEFYKFPKKKRVQIKIDRDPYSML
ncbi:MAG: primosomal protein N' [Bdellovibrionales bacterium]|nr:primosomal protein N' [Bdellovibrionales bacterium]